ncbi:nuclear transport factor 2 family protein [Micromonospora sp. NPDC049051]|uniref:nuclear transport factor 2 family protein n=1 Tax=Micromonospora sp. NPDC049051 TaxID=3364264 RepID=UPI0037245A7C
MQNLDKPHILSQRRIDQVTLYYALVDSDQIDQLVDLFAADAVYHRPGYPPLVGQHELRRFYREARVIDRGRHVLQSVLVQDDSTAVQGTFTGVLKDQTAVSLRFADFFTSGLDERFVRRDTYFFAPLV